MRNSKEAGGAKLLGVNIEMSKRPAELGVIRSCVWGKFAASNVICFKLGALYRHVEIPPIVEVCIPRQ